MKPWPFFIKNQQNKAMATVRKSSKTVNRSPLHEAQPPKRGVKKGALIVLGIAGLATLSYFGIRYMNQKKKEKKEADSLPEFKPPVPSPLVQPVIPPAPDREPDTPAPKPKRKKKTVPPDSPLIIPREEKQQQGDDFPLKQGSRGAKVKLLQEALIAKYSSSLPKGFTADGIFGRMTTGVLKKIGMPVSVSQSAYHVITQDVQPAHEKLSKLLFDAALKKDFAAVTKLLPAIKNTDQYSQVSKAFMQLRLNGVRTTLVTGLFNTFTQTNQQQELRRILLNMGLVYDGKKWTLSGLNDSPLVTIHPTPVYDMATRRSIPVRSNVLLGQLMAIKGDYTLFKNQQGLFIVATEAVKLR
jgi:type IV secretory pathway VirB10-like protein